MISKAEMDGHELIRAGVGTHETKAFARSVGCSVSLAEKYMREPASDESPDATGLVNPIERTDRIFDWLLLRHPDVAVLLAERYPRRLQAFRETQAKQPLTRAEMLVQLTKIIDEHADILKALIGGASVAEIRKENAQFQAVLEDLLCRLDDSEHCTGTLRAAS